MNDFLTKLNRHFYVLVFLASAAFYCALLFVFNVQTDIQKHVDFAAWMLRGEQFPATFLYFLAVIAVAFFRDDYANLLLASAVVLSIADAAKFFITSRLFLRASNVQTTLSENKALLFSNIAGVCLMTAVCIFLPKSLGLTEYFVLGQIPPNVWYNSTTIFLMPFAILLFWFSYQMLGEFKWKTLWLTVAMVFLNITAKPNFFLCFVSVFPLMALIRYRLRKEFFYCLIPVIVGGALLVLQYVAIYQLGSYGYGKAGDSAVTIAPFAWWRQVSVNIPVSFLISTAFPLAFLIFYFRRVTASPLLYYAYLLFAVGVAILAMFTETGVRESHGNFLWQAVVANYILFFVVLADFAKVYLETGRLDLKGKLIAAVFALHVASGWLYLAKTLLRGNFG